MRQAKVKSRRVEAGGRLLFTFIFGLFICAFASCAVDERRSVPAAAQETIDRVTEDIAAGRHDKVYEEAAPEWRDTLSAEDNKKSLARVRERLGRVNSRTFRSGREQQSASAPLSGHALEVVYQTTFERGDAVEQFTLLEREGRWLHARYSISSDLLR